MIKNKKNIQCGIFDSSVLRKNTSRSLDRRVECYELELFHSDTGVSYVDGRRHPVKRGMLLSAKPGQIRHSEFPIRCSFIRLFVGADSDFEETLAAFPECVYIDSEDEVLRLLGLFARLGTHTASSISSDWRNMRINADLSAILYQCMRLGESSSEGTEDGTHSRLVREAYEYINENFTRPCSLKEIAAEMHVSPNYLHTVFKRSVGMTPFALVTLKRIDKAKLLILAGEKSILEIALEVGFCSQSHFNKVFLKETGLTPAAYRRSIAKCY